MITWRQSTADGLSGSATTLSSSVRADWKAKYIAYHSVQRDESSVFAMNLAMSCRFSTARDRHVLGVSLVSSSYLLYRFEDFLG